MSAGEVVVVGLQPVARGERIGNSERIFSSIASADAEVNETSSCFLFGEEEEKFGC